MKLIAKGKVRDIYDLDDKRLLIVTSDRISAFDYVLKSNIPDKGKFLNKIALFWFDFTKDIIDNHLLEVDKTAQDIIDANPDFDERYMVVRKLKILPYEFIVRDYITGSLWKAYKNGDMSGDAKRLPAGLKESQKLPELMFCLTTKAESGHDEPITFDEVAQDIGYDLIAKVKEASLKMFEKCSKYAQEKGILLADTKFEFGQDEDGKLYIADEMFTPDSSRFWDKSKYKVGEMQDSLDKQIVRNWLIDNKLDNSAALLSDEIIEKLRSQYLNLYNILCR